MNMKDTLRLNALYITRRAISAAVVKQRDKMYPPPEHPMKVLLGQMQKDMIKDTLPGAITMQ